MTDPSGSGPAQATDPETPLIGKGRDDMPRTAKSFAKAVLLQVYPTCPPGERMEKLLSLVEEEYRKEYPNVSMGEAKKNLDAMLENELTDKMKRFLWGKLLDRQEIIDDFEADVKYLRHLAVFIASLQLFSKYASIWAATWASIILLGAFASVLQGDFIRVTAIIIFDTVRVYLVSPSTFVSFQANSQDPTEEERSKDGLRHDLKSWFNSVMGITQADDAKGEAHKSNEDGKKTKKKKRSWRQRNWMKEAAVWYLEGWIEWSPTLSMVIQIGCMVANLVFSSVGIYRGPMRYLEEDNSQAADVNEVCGPHFNMRTVLTTTIACQLKLAEVDNRGAMKNLPLSLFAVYVLSILSCGSGLIAISLFNALYPRRSRYEPSLRYWYLDVFKTCWNESPKAALESKFFQRLFVILADYYEAWHRPDEIIKMNERSHAYMFAHRSGVNTVVGTLDSEFWAHQRAAACMVGSWASLQGKDLSFEIPLLNKLLEKAGIGQVGFNVLRTIENIADKAKDISHWPEELDIWRHVLHCVRLKFPRIAALGVMGTLIRHKSLRDNLGTRQPDKEWDQALDAVVQYIVGLIGPYERVRNLVVEGCVALQLGAARGGRTTTREELYQLIKDSLRKAPGQYILPKEKKWLEEMMGKEYHLECTLNAKEKYDVKGFDKITDDPRIARV